MARHGGATLLALHELAECHRQRTVYAFGELESVDDRSEYVGVASLISVHSSLPKAKQRLRAIPPLCFGYNKNLKEPCSPAEQEERVRALRAGEEGAEAFFDLSNLSEDSHSFEEWKEEERGRMQTSVSEHYIEDWEVGPFRVGEALRGGAAEEGGASASGAASAPGASTQASASGAPTGTAPTAMSPSASQALGRVLDRPDLVEMIASALRRTPSHLWAVWRNFMPHILGGYKEEAHWLDACVVGFFEDLAQAKAAQQKASNGPYIDPDILGEYTSGPEIEAVVERLIRTPDESPESRFSVELFKVDEPAPSDEDLYKTPAYLASQMPIGLWWLSGAGAV